MHVVALIAQHLLVDAFVGACMKKAFVCEALKGYALAFPDVRQQSVPAASEPSVIDELRCLHACGFFAGSATGVHVFAGSRTSI
jgi:hypothetical protein